MRQIAEDVLRERYYQPGETCWEDIAKRVSNFIGNDEKSREEYFNAINNLEIIPNSPCLMNAGCDNPQMSACFCVPMNDSIESIFDAVKYAALIHKSGGGTGFNVSNIRAKGSTVKGTGHVASGPISFLNVFNQATETIKQGGKRRGANLAAIDIDHPDIKEFITCKTTEGDLSNFNISVNITDEFMNHPNPEVWNLIVEGNWRNGEPGILFQDIAERDNPTPSLGRLKYRNPCTEVCLLEWESCNLASINLMCCFIDGKFNTEKFYNLVRLGVRFLDDMIDKNKYPLPQIEEATKKTRKIGLGVMGFADLLIALGMRYGDEKSLQFTDALFHDMKHYANNESTRIAGIKGVYPASHEDTRRNAAVLSIAPTGSISLFAGVSSGIEPNFGYVYDRNTFASGEKVKYREIHPIFEEHLKQLYDPQKRERIIDYVYEYGSIEGCIDVYRNSDLFVTAKDISPMDHIRMQATIQKHIDQAISKTINCPAETTKEEISKMIKFAWKSGCKGLTIYREGSRKDVVLETNATKKDESKVIEVTNLVQYKLATANGRILPKTPRDMPATVHKRTTACGKLYVIPAEAFDQLHSLFLVNKGGCDAMTQVIAELIGSMCRFGIPRWEITRICSGIVCPACRNKRKLVDGNSCADIIARVILENYPDDEEPPKCIEKSNEDTTEKVIINKVPCPKCGEVLIMQEGCRTCPSCGYSKCSG